MATQIKCYWGRPSITCDCAGCKAARVPVAERATLTENLDFAWAKLNDLLGGVEDDTIYDDDALLSGIEAARDAVEAAATRAYQKCLDDA